MTMNSKFLNFAMFVFGAAIGSAVTWKYIKEKYEQIAQEEIDSVKETFSKVEPKNKNHGKVEENHAQVRAERENNKSNIVEYAAKLQENGYTNYSNMSNGPEKNNKPSVSVKEEDNKQMVDGGPYVIPPEEFGEFDDYEKISLTFYADKVLTDDDDQLIDNIEEIVGNKALESFGDYEDDSVFVRNNKLKCDYEILLDQRKYLDVIKGRPQEVDE